MYKALCLAALLLTACGGSEEAGKPAESVQQAQAAKNAETAASVEEPASARAEKTDQSAEEARGISSQGEPALPREEPPTQAQAAYANRVLDWNNRVQNILARGSLADKTAACAEFYLETWHLPRRPKGPYVRDFAPAPGLIKGQAARLIDEFLAAMDKASDSMLMAYGRLESYMQDPSIQDDGKLGRELAGQVGDGYKRYLAARKSFMAIVEQKTEEAEDTLLRGHPLKRQIRLAQCIFAQFRQTGDLLASGNPAHGLLRASGDNLRKLIGEAGKPPFAASPHYERLYRQFLKKAGDYAAVLDRGLTEGFHSLQKRELLRALNTCRDAYNDFAAAINENS